jgi:hypothetical protein
MLHVLFYLLLQLGLLGGPSNDQKASQAHSTAPTTQADAVLKVDTPVTDVEVGTDVSIGGSGWDDKN